MEQTLHTSEYTGQSAQSKVCCCCLLHTHFISNVVQLISVVMFGQRNMRFRVGQGSVAEVLIFFFLFTLGMEPQVFPYNLEVFYSTLSVEVLSVES